MKKAVIAVGGNQYVVEEGQVIEVDHLKDAKKSLEFAPLLTIDGDKTVVGTPEVAGGKVTAEVTEALSKADKVTSIRYKSKKRVHKVHGHRQHQTKLTIKKIV
jgi:large subunit ribosomal protein L21